MPPRRTAKSPAKLKTKISFNPEVKLKGLGAPQPATQNDEQAAREARRKEQQEIFLTAMAGAFLEVLGVSAESVQRLSREDFAKEVSRVKAVVVHRITWLNPDYAKTYLAFHLPEFQEFQYPSTPLDFPLSDKLDYLTANAVRQLPREQLKPLLSEIESQLTDWYKSQPSSATATTSSTIEPPETETHEPEMPQGEGIVFKGGTLFKGGRPYRPFAVAAQRGQAPRQTLRDWIKNKTEFQGEPLQALYLEPLGRYFVSEESIERMAHRFIKWRDGEAAGPAGPVTIGKTKDQSGFLSTSESARILGVSPRTTWLWASQQGKAPTDKPLDVIKDSISEHFYIREKDVNGLKKLIPRSGLQRGRRPQEPQF